MLKIKRAYEARGPGNGVRILVDRLWPRGLRREEAGIDEWQRDLAPSDALRQWFGHEPEKWPEFKRRYWEELSSPERLQALERIARMARDGDVTLVYSARDTEHSNARVLEERISQLMADMRPK